MNRRLLNVENAPGSNGLRGGIKQYSSKTTTGPWLDTYGGPMGYKRGFHSADFETEAQHAQLGVVCRKPGEFGAGIPIIDNRDKSGNDMNATGTENWISNTKATHPNFGVIKKEDMAFKLLQPKLSREKLMEYRRQWTCDKESSRTIRFQTESRLAGNAVGGKFYTNTVRILPGTPKSMEEYRSRLVERYGIFALAALRFHIGIEQLPIQEFRDRIQDIGVAIKPYELSQIIAYITPSCTHVSYKDLENFLLIMKGHTDGFNIQAVSNVFFSLCSTSEEDATLPLGSLLCSIDHDVYPEFSTGIAKFLPVYIGEKEEVNVHQFIELHDDMYASTPTNFNEVLHSIWRL